MSTITDPAAAPRAFEAAWNAHDMDAFGALFHAHASFVNRFGTYVRGVDAIVAQHQAIHETIYSDSTLKAEVIAIDAVAEGVAIVHFWCRLATGAAHPAGPHAVDTLILAVLTRPDDVWRFQAVENVTLVDPRTGAQVLREA